MKGKVPVGLHEIEWGGGKGGKERSKRDPETKHTDFG